MLQDICLIKDKNYHDLIYAVDSDNYNKNYLNIRSILLKQQVKPDSLYNNFTEKIKLYCNYKENIPLFVYLILNI